MTATHDFNEQTRLLVEAYEDAGRRNPYGWRWKLVLWLTGGMIQVVPTLPARPIHSRETMTVHLGEPGALNTGAVAMDQPRVSGVIPMDNYKLDPIPGTFMAVDVDDPGLPSEAPRRIVGGFIGWGSIEDPDRPGIVTDSMVIDVVDGIGRVEIPLRSITQGYWVPLGYRR